ncbi:DoxX family protein [Mycolicibacterium aubagnense]
MNMALWIIAGVLAFVFAGSGVMKLVVPKDKLVASGQGWAADVDPNAIRGIGVVEFLGAIGLIVPPLVHILPVLAPLAAVGLVLVMLGAIVTHGRRKEYPNVVVNLVLLALAVFVAWGRFGPYAF